MDNKVEIIINVNTKQSKKAMDDLNSSMTASLRGMTGGFMRFGAGLAVVAVALKGLEAVGKGLYAVFEKGIEVTINTERAEAGIAGLIASVYELKDASGNLLTGPDKFTASVKLAREQVRQLRIDAITSALSAEELNETFMQGIGPGAAAGLDEEQVRKMTVAVGQAGKVMLPRKGMVPQELRALLSGNIDRNATIGQALGLGPKGASQAAYKEALATGKVYDFLMDKLKEFDKAAKMQAQGIGGTIDQVKDISGLFSMDASTGLVEELKGIQKITDELFNKDTHQWADSLLPAMAVFKTIGALLGQEIVGAVKKVVEWTEKFGQYLKDDQSLISGLAALWETVKFVIGVVVDIVFDIFKLVGDICSVFISALIPAIGESGGKLSAMQGFMMVLNALAGGLAIAFGGVKDVIVGIIGIIRILVGSVISGIGQIAVTASKYVVAFADTIGAKDTSNIFKGLIKSGEERIDIGRSIAIDNNPLVQNIKKNGFWSGISQGLQGGFDKAIEGIALGGQSNNPEFMKQWIKMMEDIKKAGEKPGESTVKGGGPLNTGKGKKEKVRSEANALYNIQKAMLEGEIALNKEMAKQEEAILEDKFKNNLITAEEYYNEKRKLSNKDFDEQMRLLNLQKQEALSKPADNAAQVLQNKGEAMKIEQEILLLKLKQINAVADLDREEKNYLNTKKKQASLDNIENAKLDAQNKLAIDKINQEQLLALKQINSAQSLQIEKSRIDDEYRLEYEALQAKKALAKDNLDDQRNINMELLELNRKYAEQRSKIDNDIKLDSQKDAMEIQQTFEDSFATMIEEISGGKKSFLDAIKDFAKAIESEFARLAARKVASQIFGDGGDKGGGGLLSGIGSFFAKGISGGGWSLPSFDVGTDYVPHDMVAQIHKGEKIVPAKYNNNGSSGGGSNIVNNFIMQQTPDMRTQQQIAAAVGSEVNRARNRNG